MSDVPSSICQSGTRARRTSCVAVILGAGGTQRLPRAVGKSKAMDMVLTARMMDAAEAERTASRAAWCLTKSWPTKRWARHWSSAASRRSRLSRPRNRSTARSKAALNDGEMFEGRPARALFATGDEKEGMDASRNNHPPDLKNA